MRPTRVQALLEVAAVIAKRSTCDRLHVGAVVARDGRILTTGYNGAPSGMPHCDHLNWHPAEPCNVTVHAEANAIAFASRYGMSTEGAEMFLTHSPCLACAKLIINAGIVKVFYATPFRVLDGVELLQSAGIGTDSNGY